MRSFRFRIRDVVTWKGRYKVAINHVMTNSYHRDSLSKKAGTQKVEINAIEESYKKAMKNYSEIALKHIEEGEPSYQIGATSMTEKEWDTLITKIDTSIDQIKEELKERIKVHKEREEKQRIAKEIEEEKKLAKKDLEEKELKEFFEKDKLEKKVEEDIVEANQDNVITEEQIKQLLM